MLRFITFLLLAILSGISMADDACTTLFDFSSPATVGEWRSVNDGVMGGRSRGGPEAIDKAMLFSGVINTNGGGFSSVRAPLAIASLSGKNAFRLDWKPDKRRYQISIQTNVTYRGRPIAYRADIRALASDEWLSPTIFFSELKATIFGQSINAPAFDPDNATRISLFINDGKDGPFRVEVASISACAL